MHLITAAVMSLLANKGFRGSGVFAPFGKPIPSFRGIIEYVHGMPGRYRFRIPSLRGAPESAALLAEKIPMLPGVGTVNCDGRTGSVVVEGTEETDPGLLVAAMARILGLDAEIERAPTSRFTTTVKHFWTGLDRVLYERSGGICTAADAIGLMLLGAAVLQVRKTRTLGPPPAFTLIWWFYTLTSGKRSHR